MLSASKIAKYFLFRAAQDEELLTNLKLQKLLYYAQGFSLAIFDKPLFNESIESWTHGPVVPDIYHAYKEHAANPLPPILELDFSLDDETKELLNEVYSVYGQFTAFALRNMTHQEPPWIQTPSGSIISLELMKSFFKTRVEKNGEDQRAEPK